MKAQINDFFTTDLELLNQTRKEIMNKYGISNSRITRLNDLENQILSLKELDSGNNKKYRARKVKIGDLKFDSIKEARRYIRLVLKECKGEILNLMVHPRFEIQPPYYNKLTDTKIRGIYYTSDFSYVEDGIQVVEDIKGFVTDISKLRMKIFAYKYQDVKLIIGTASIEEL